MNYIFLISDGERICSLDDRKLWAIMLVNMLSNLVVSCTLCEIFNILCFGGFWLVFGFLICVCWSVLWSCLLIFLIDLSIYLVCVSCLLICPILFVQHPFLLNTFACRTPPIHTVLKTIHAYILIDRPYLLNDLDWYMLNPSVRSIPLCYLFVLSFCVMVFVGLGRAESLKIRINEKSKFPAGRSEWVARDWADQENRLFGSGMVDHLCKKNMGGQYEWAGVCPVGWLWTG